MLNDGVGFEIGLTGGDDAFDATIVPPKKTILSPDLFDVLELSALIHGGVGASCLGEEKRGQQVPVCVMGHALWLDGTLNGEHPGPVTSRLAKAFGFTPEDYDHVFPINDAPIEEEFTVRGVGCSYQLSKTDEYGDPQIRYRRVSFKKWCKLVGVERRKDRKPKAQRVPTKAEQRERDNAFLVGAQDEFFHD